MVKTRTWIIMIAALAAVCVILSIFIFGKGTGGNIAEVVLDGEVIEEIDLSSIKEEYSFRVEAADGGYNVVTVKSGKICISDADCPDKVCVHHSWLVNKEAPIICMPHKLIIRYKADDGIDAVVR